jgi:transcriptional regulator with GAF, ATPase, and Fis domain
VKPLPETQAAIDRLSALLEGDQDLGRHLRAVSSVAEMLVPSLVGASVTVHIHGQPFTLTAVSEQLRTMDATQYLDGGPCVDALDGSPVVVDDLLDEERWQVYRQTASDAGIRSSLSMPLRDSADEVIGALNLYATDPSAFAGQEQMFAEVFGVHVEELVKNADLSFMTRDWAEELPDRVEALEVTEQAVGVLVATQGWGPDDARSRLQDAAGRAGAPLDTVARAVLALSSS